MCKNKFNEKSSMCASELYMFKNEKWSICSFKLYVSKNKLSKKYGIKYINGIHMNSVQADEALRIISKFYKNKLRK